MLPAKPKLHFARYEFKYVLPKNIREEVERELQYFVELDPFVSSTAGNSYFVRSLYFDDPSYTSFYEKIDGMCSREKFRLRTYTNQPHDGTAMFLEVKGRHNNLVTKHRVMLNGKAGDDLGNDDALAAQILRKTGESPVRRQFEYELYRKRLRPVALIDYRRRPYISKFDPEFRLTFDEGLCFTATDAVFPSSAESYRRGLPGFTIMEIKFRYHVPSWFYRIIASYELNRVSVSKICSALEVLELADNLS
jgi:hypothetical protein